jgi:predicted acyl esterase
VPGEVTEYRIEILATANLFKAGHRICLEITSMDRPTGVAGATNVEYVPYHVCSSRTTLHHIHHDTEHPSHLLLPVIPEDAA